MNNTSFESNVDESTFWRWFESHNSDYYYLNQITDLDKREALLNEFLVRLHEYCNKLYFEIGGVPNEPQELIISAGGDPDYFQQAETLVAKAPRINDWKIIALKPPSQVDFVTRYEDLTLDVREIWFLPLESESNPKALGLRLCIPVYSPQLEERLLNACYVLLDTVLGEKSAALDIRHLEVSDLPANPEEKGLIEMKELTEYIAWRKQSI